ncbi:MAG TPA: NAD-dependent epimerase/dehydratase family protein [Rhizomicrobium sp.]
MAETVLVTGGTGFVGGWCVAKLLKRGYSVRTTVRSLAKAPAVSSAVITADPGDRLSFFQTDLNSDTGWDEAVAGCDYILHVASPLGHTGGDVNALISAARDGALRVLRAAVKAGVKRVVLTSSAAASAPLASVKDAVSDETLWTDPDGKGLTPYRRSKVIAEKAAWDFINTSGGKTELVTILPTGIFGPVLTTDGLGSVQIVQRLMQGALPGMPHFGMNVVDVRDVADAHIRAMTMSEAAGQRFIAGSGWLWMDDIGRILRETFGDRAKKVPVRRLPSFVLRLLSLFRPELKDVTVMLDRKHDVTSAKAQRVLGWTPRPPETAIVDCADSLIAKNAV